MKIKNYIFFFACVFLGLIAKAQNCQKIIVSDSLFPKTSAKFNFDKPVGNFLYFTQKENITDLNEIVEINNNCLKFTICYGCCVEKEIYLITDGVLQQDKQKNRFYKVKVYFLNDELCKKLCHSDVKFDLSGLKLQNFKTFIRLEDFDQLLEIK